MIGDKISITEGDEVKYGIFEDVDENGFLLLKDNHNKIEKIHYGDLSLR
jgi:BirA family biotin operon repressor/biotin-[acetyl-CoA-carboxylase] ligase